MSYESETEAGYKELKVETVKLAAGGGFSLTQVAGDMGISANMFGAGVAGSQPE